MTELVIFDCDGVLVDSDRLSLAIQARHITALGLPMTAADCSREFLGIGMESTLETIAARLGRPLPPSFLPALEAEVEETFRRELQAVPGVVAALDEITLPTCIASGGSQEKMRLTLGLTRCGSASRAASSAPAKSPARSRPRICSAMRRRPSGLAKRMRSSPRCRSFRRCSPQTRPPALARAFPGSIPGCS